MGDISEVIEDFVDIIRQHPNQLDQMVENAYEESDGEYSIDEIREAMVELVPFTPPAIVKPSKVVFSRPSLRAHDAEGKGRKAHYREMKQKAAILDIVDSHPQGIAKTIITGLLRKDNSHWRPLITRWLREMVGDRVIQTDGSRFYPYDVILKDREMEIHRLIYECIGSHEKRSVTTTEIAKFMGCYGGKTWYIVQQGLKTLEERGFVEYKNRRWVWKKK